MKMGWAPNWSRVLEQIEQTRKEEEVKKQKEAERKDDKSGTAG